MLRISKLTDYGTVILACLASQPNRLWTAAEVAEQTRLGLPTVSKLLKKLQRNATWSFRPAAAMAATSSRNRPPKSQRHASWTHSKVRLRSPSAAVSTATAASNRTAASDMRGSASMPPSAVRSTTSHWRNSREPSVAHPRQSRSAAWCGRRTSRRAKSLVPWQAIHRTIPLSKHWSARSTGTASSRISKPIRFRPGLDEDVIRLISRKKEEPQFMLDWRLKAYRHWLTMREPHWAHLRIAPIDYQAISYYSAPKARCGCAEESRGGRPETARDLRQARHSAARARAAGRRRRRCGVRQRLGRHHVQGASCEGRRDLLFVLRGGAEVSASWSRSISARSCRTRTTTSRR